MGLELNQLFELKDELISGEEATQAILKAVGKENHPIKGLIEIFLMRWEQKIRDDQLKIDEKMVKKVMSESVNETKTQSND